MNERKIAKGGKRQAETVCTWKCQFPGLRTGGAHGDRKFLWPEPAGVVRSDWAQLCIIPALRALFH